MKLVRLIVLMTSLLFCIPANSETTDENKEVSARPEQLRPAPVGNKIEHDGVELQCYNLEEYRQLAFIIVDYRGLWDYTLLLEQNEKTLNREIDLLEGKTTLLEYAMNTQKQRAEMWKILYETDHKYVLSVQEGIRKTKWIPWAMMAGLTAITSVALIVQGDYD